MAPATPRFDQNPAFILLEACGLLPPRSDAKTYASLIQKAQAEMDRVQADMRQLQSEMRQTHQSNRDEIAAFRRDLAALASQVSRGVQLGHARAMRTTLEMRLYAVLSRECDLQEEVEVRLVERMRGVGGLGERAGEKATVEGIVRAIREMGGLKREKERKGAELERVVKVRVRVEREVEALEGGGGGGWRCGCEEKMCEGCMECLTVCGECEEVGRQWEEVVKAAAVRK